MFDSATSARIEELLANFLLHFAASNQDVSDPPQSVEEAFQHGGRDGGAAPFHFALFPEIVRFKTLERSFSSNLGSVFEQIALAIASERFIQAGLQHHVKGRVRPNVISQIDQIIKDYETVGPAGRLAAPNIVREHAVLDSLSGPGGDDFDENVDLFAQSGDQTEHYFHMKTVKPNKDQSNKAKRLMLRVHAIRFPNPTRVFFGMPYNPYGEGMPYRWSFPKPYFDFEREVLVGGAFWDYLGGPDTYLQLMKLAVESGENVHAQVKRDLGLT